MGSLTPARKLFSYVNLQDLPYGEGKSKAYKDGGSDNLSAHHMQSSSRRNGCEFVVTAKATYEHL